MAGREGAGRDLGGQSEDLLWVEDELGVWVDLASTRVSSLDLTDRYEKRFTEALLYMEALEGGALANPDERRMVGHYWLRAPQLAPNAEIQKGILAARDQITAFKRDHGDRFSTVLMIGIGGSALGPQLLVDALRPSGAKRWLFIDNTDPDGMARVLGEIQDVRSCLCIVTSKSGGTKETQNGLRVAERVWQERGASLASNCVAITQAGSKLDHYAKEQGWLARFPLWEWVGGRTSIFSPVGLLPAALHGVCLEEFLAGARDMDVATRSSRFLNNPAGLLAAVWHRLRGEGGERAMVVLPYADRLLLLSRYLQQLIMESLGKRCDLQGREVFEGITVYGNKGSTDQHAYVQQLRDGVPHFFASFLHVREGAECRNPLDRLVGSVEVEPGVTSGDYLHGFALGTEEALCDQGRPSYTIGLDRLDPYRLGALIALFERAVGMYASYVGINAYHQPGVEAGKVAAEQVLEQQALLWSALEQASPNPISVARLADDVGVPPRRVWYILRHLASNQRIGHQRGATWRDEAFFVSQGEGASS